MKPVQSKDIFEVFEDLEYILNKRPDLLQQSQRRLEGTQSEKKVKSSTNSRKKSVTSVSKKTKTKSNHGNGPDKKREVLDHPRKTSPKILGRISEPEPRSGDNTSKLQRFFLIWLKKLLEKLMNEDTDSHINLDETSPAPGDLERQCISSNDCIYPNSFDIQDTPDMNGTIRTTHSRAKPQGEVVVRDFSTGTRRPGNRYRHHK